ncbi:hypothetical protein GUJ93_ZPchr0012g22029 [Zizania palustris]|uniref:Uncharacterized protein n=1 Tax=Zizania palustris TaxID=103762 RepID=A0A8J5WJE1_ZIZPA|nr:hypothetical protein GUJ93_ZPchr0012g22029 [Zizania palustris]
MVIKTERWEVGVQAPLYKAWIGASSVELGRVILLGLLLGRTILTWSGSAEVAVALLTGLAVGFGSVDHRPNQANMALFDRLTSKPRLP